MKRSFFQAAVVSILLYGCTTWTLTKQMEKKLDGNYTRMMRAILNNTPQSTCCTATYLPSRKLSKTNQTCRVLLEKQDELISDVLLWTPSYDRAKAGRPARTNIQQLCEAAGCCPEDLPEAMNDREEWRERVRDIRAGSMT